MMNPACEMPSTVTMIRETLISQLQSRWFAFFAATVAGLVLIFARTPTPLMEQGFYAEDGSDYIEGMLNHGFVHTLNRARPDYFVLGNIFLTQLSVWAWKLVGSGDILSLPLVLSVTANLFYAVVFALPWLLFRTTHPAYLFGLWLCSVFVPLGASDFEVFGRMANTGFVFLYLAFLLAWYRHTMDESFAVLPVDLGLAFCAWTNPLCFALFPLLLWRFWRSRDDRLIDVISRPTFLSGVLLAVLCAPAAIKIIRAPKREHAGAARVTLTKRAAIEMGVARNALHPLVHPVYHSMRTSIVLVCAALLTAAFVFYGRPERRWLYAAGAFMVGCSSLVLVATRPEVQLPPHYTGTFPDRYYFAQNLIVLFLLTHLLEDFVARTRRQWRTSWLVPVALLVFYFTDVTRQSTFGKGSPVLTGQGDFRYCVRRAVEERAFCDLQGTPRPDGEYLHVREAPYGWVLRVAIKDLPSDLQRTAVVANAANEGVRR
jgi:hypothetical protein